MNAKYVAGLCLGALLLVAGCAAKPLPTPQIESLGQVCDRLAPLKDATPQTRDEEDEYLRVLGNARAKSSGEITGAIIGVQDYSMEAFKENPDQALLDELRPDYERGTARMAQLCAW
ncbi:hypothetical protein [Arthrobacter sp. CJ23]|uniref:hypothetical protein n=1 Tax=Arthrobacter sp. CJ23 TaxID=2972479 RepID=UPI00215D5451|nr:hypothetical protein [Arthrobacter sp. CJ23]UVJ39415.1 hypothetical protein NVV90_19830 [Arthrobacter sp. CJ23]